MRVVRSVRPPPRLPPSSFRRAFSPSFVVIADFFKSFCLLLSLDFIFTIKQTLKIDSIIQGISFINTLYIQNIAVNKSPLVVMVMANLEAGSTRLEVTFISLVLFIVAFELLLPGTGSIFIAKYIGRHNTGLTTYASVIAIFVFLLLQNVLFICGNLIAIYLHIASVIVSQIETVWNV